VLPFRSSEVPARGAGLSPSTAPEETLVADSRAGMTPAQMVERKLAGLLKANPRAISHAQLRAGTLRRGAAGE
jgi:hypothetical protein